jgi:NADH:ubiquinone oxidoreductase subunit F (NADH-binding)
MQNILLRFKNEGRDAAADFSRQEAGYLGWQAARAVRADAIADTVEQAGLAGKGGGGFPTHKKMRLMQQQSAAKKFLVVNGSEHEPGSLKDRHLLEHYSDTVLEGALIMAYAVGASDIVVAINRAAGASVARFNQALAAAQADSSIDFAGIQVAVQTVPDSYIVGEESALLEVLEGREPLPRKKPPYPIEQGLHGQPTLIQNVETVSHLPFIMSHGAAAYRARGVNGRGVTLCTLGTEFVHAGVHEIPLGTPIREILYGWGGGLRDGSQIKAVQPGGPSSGFLIPSQFDLGLDADELSNSGAALGCAVIRAYSENDCMVRELGRIMSFFAHGSCGQCPQCKMETQMLATIVKQILDGKGNWKLLDRVTDVLNFAKGAGICGLIKMPAAPIETGIVLFREEFAAHIEHNCSLCAAGKSIEHDHGAMLAGSHAA